MTHGFPLENCSALITGASSGLGAEFARQLAPHATELILVARRADVLEEVQAQISGQKARVTCFAADLSSDIGRASLMAFLDENQLSPNLLINNAGLGDYGPFATSPIEKTRLQIDLNITALTLLTHGLLPKMKGRGGILNISSLASTLPMPELAVYAASKSYVTSFSEALSIELAPRGITVTCVCPGPTPTNFSQTAKRQNGSDTNRDGQALLRIPPAQVVSEALDALRSGRPCVFPGTGVKVAGCLFRMLPRFLMRRLLRQRMRREAIELKKL